MRKCSICGRMLEDSHFYDCDKYRCKECQRKKKKLSYDKHHPQVYMSGNEKLMKRSRGHPAYYWNGNMLSDLKRHYPDTSNMELAELFGLSERTITRKARELGLTKSKEYIRKVAKINSIMGHIALKSKIYDSTNV